MKRHGNAQHQGAWYTASREQRLEQIDAAIKLGLTARFVARNYQMTGDLAADYVLAFATYHGRRFQEAANVRSEELATGRRKKRLTPYQERRHLARLYFTGEPVDMSGGAK